MRNTQEIDYELHGEELQLVEITLDQGEQVVAEAGAFMYMEQGIHFETMMSDGSKTTTSLMNKLVNAGKRLMVGEGVFITRFTNMDSFRRKIAFSAPYPGRIIPIDLRDHGNMIICQKSAFLCAARGLSIDIAFQKKFGVGFFGGEGFTMERLKGEGLVFLHSGGTIIQRHLEGGETLRIDTGCLVALSTTVEYDIQMVGGVKNTFFGGEGAFFTTLSGPGTVWLQSMPFSRVADRIMKSAIHLNPQSYGE
jgi:uncharacterized protein (TIGR00266 family)